MCVCVCAHMRVCVCVHMCVCMHVCVCVCVCLYVCVHACLCMCVHPCLCVCVCVFVRVHVHVSPSPEQRQSYSCALLAVQKPLKRILVEDTGVVAPGNIGTSDPVPLIEDLTERSSCSSSTTGNTSDVSCVGRDVATSSSELIPQACMISESSSGKGSTVERPLESQSELASEIASGTEPSPGLPGNVGSKMTVVSDVASGLQQLHQDKGQQDKGQQSGGVSSGCKGRRPVEVPGVPHTSLQFQADWRQLRGDRDRMAEYFKVG